MPFLDLPTGIRMYFEVHGEKGDPFLLLGGTGSDHTLWTHHLPALAVRFRVIVPDPRGTGATTRPAAPTTCTMRVMADDAAGLLDGLGLGPAHVAGLSLGSAVAMELGAARPDLVRSLHLHGAWARSDRWFVEMMEIMEYPARLGDLRGFLRLALPCILSRDFLADEDACRERFEAIGSTAPFGPRFLEPVGSEYVEIGIGISKYSIEWNGHEKMVSHRPEVAEAHIAKNGQVLSVEPAQPMKPETLSKFLDRLRGYVASASAQKNAGMKQ